MVKVMQLAPNAFRWQAIRNFYRVSGFVVDLDSARYLWHRLFANEKAEELEQSLRAKEIYQRRCQSTYDHLFSLDTEALYNKVRAQWHGRSGRAF